MRKIRPRREKVPASWKSTSAAIAPAHTSQFGSLAVSLWTTPARWQPAGPPEVFGHARTRDLHRAALDPRACQDVTVPRDQLGNARDAAECLQRSCLARGEPACEPAQPPACGSRVAADAARVAI